MRRIKDEFLQRIEEVVPLGGLSVLEIGCGDGSRSVAMAECCRSLVGIEPNQDQLERAVARNLVNARFQKGSAEHLPFQDQTFDVIIFTLSFHHVPLQQMSVAIDEAVRVVRPSGRIIFLEPAQEGSFFEAEIAFDACDGDERREKTAAHEAMMRHSGLQALAEVADETVFQFDSLDDFITSMVPKKNLEKIEDFLRVHDFTLNAHRRINVFQPFSRR